MTGEKASRAWDGVSEKRARAWDGVSEKRRAIVRPHLPHGSLRSRDVIVR